MNAGVPMEVGQGLTSFRGYLRVLEQHKQFVRFDDEVDSDMEAGAMVVDGGMTAGLSVAFFKIRVN